MAPLLIVALDAANFMLALLLVTLGLIILFGLMNVINMAHGEMFLLGAYAVVLVERHGGGFWLALALAPLALAVIGLLIEELVIRHVYHRFIDTILATWGLSISLKQTVIIAFGPTAQQVDNPLPQAVAILGTRYPVYRLFIMAVAVLIATGTFLLFYRTSLGLVARAVIANRPMASSLGLNPRRMDRLTFAFGIALTLAVWLLLGACPLLVGEWRLSQLAQITSYGIFAMSLAFLWGQTGLLCFGHAIFFGTGAYVMGLITKGMLPGVGDATVTG